MKIEQIVLSTAILLAAGRLSALGANPIFTRSTQVTSDDGQSQDHYGWAVSVSGDVVVVGAQDADIGINTDQGAAYVYERNHGGNDNWGQVKKLIASDGAAYNDFGYSVGVNGDIIVVGAPVADVSGKQDQGAAYVFVRNQGGANNWGQVKKLTASDGAASDQFGFSVAISGEVAVVGAVVDDNQRGSAYVFERNRGGNDNWGQVKKLVASDGVAGDQVGYAVAASGNVIVLGAPVDAIGLNSNQGSAYLFERNQGGSNNWGQVKRLNAADGAGGDQLGFSVAVSGDVVIAGAVVDNGGQGSAYVFSRNQGGVNNWGQVKRISASDGAANDWFGYSVAVSGDSVLVGAPQDDIDPYIDIGSAYLFERNQGGANNWGQAQKLTPTDGVGFDNIGFSVAVDAGVAVAGALFDDVGPNQDQGSAYVFWLPVIHLLPPVWAGGEFQVTMSGTPGLDCSLLMSSNLADWASVTNVTLPDAPMLITVPADSDRGFFRAVSPPIP